MQVRMNLSHQGSWIHRRAAGFKVAAGVALGLTAILAIAQTAIPPPGVRNDRVDLPTPINQPPDAVHLMEMRAALEQQRGKSFVAANKERRKQIAEDSARLLKMAAGLKAEVEKATGDAASVNLIREAGDIEKLAHAVKEKMELSIRQQ